jgi:energy-coupling factor transporter ATP-binding protein EcfA2
MATATRNHNEVVQYDFVPWDTFLRRFLWRQGEHVVAIAPTGGGKTTLLSRILPRRRHVVVLVTKTYDETITREFKGYRRISTWPPPGYVDRVLLWPKPGPTVRDTVSIQRDVFRQALDKIFIERGWTVVIDEEHWLCHNLKLELEVATFHHQGRSSGLTVVDGIQRPAWVPVVTYGSASHAFLWKTTDADDMRRLKALGGVNAVELATNLLKLRPHELIYVPTRSGRPPIRTMVNL